MPVGKEEIRNRFGYHPATDKTAIQHVNLREAYIAFLDYLDENLPDGRAKSTAFTKLQESSMWAHFGVAEQAPVQLPPNEAARATTPGVAMAAAAKPGPRPHR